MAWARRRYGINIPADVGDRCFVVVSPEGMPYVWTVGYYARECRREFAENLIHPPGCTWRDKWKELLKEGYRVRRARLVLEFKP